MKYIFLLLLILSSGALAKPIYHLELGVGRASQYADSSYSLSETNGNSNSFGVRGLLSFNKYLLIDLAHYQYGEIKNSVQSLNLPRSNSVSTASTQLAIQGRLYIFNEFYFGGRIGYSFHDNQVGYTQNGSDFKRTSSGENPFLGVGIGYVFNNKIGISFEYTYLEAKSDVDGLSYENVIENSSIGISYTFR